MGKKLARAAGVGGTLAVALLVWLAVRGDSAPRSERAAAPREVARKAAPPAAPTPDPKAPEAEKPGVKPEPEPTPVEKRRRKPPAEPPPPVEETRDPSLAALRVLVVDERETPRAGASVWLTDYKRGKRREKRETGADGRAEIRNFAPGKQQLSVRLGALQRIFQIELVAGRVSRQTVVIPSAGAVVEGIVRHGQKGPLAEASVTMRARSDASSDFLHGRTDAGGHYRIEAVPPGAYGVEVSAPSLAPRSRSAGELRVTAAETVRHDIEVGIVSLHAIVKNAETGRPIPGITVLMRRPGWGERVTDDDGVCRFLDLPAGKAELTVAPEGYEMQFPRPGEIEPGKTLRVEIGLKPAAILHLHVTDERGGPVVGRVSIAVSKPDSPSSSGTTIGTDDEGHAIYRKIAPGPCHISLKSEGFDWSHQRVELRRGENTLRVLLKRLPERRKKKEGKPALRGRVLDAETGRPIRKVRISLGRLRVYTDSEGNYVLRDLPPGKYPLKLSRDGYGFRMMRDVEVDGDRVRTLDLELEPAATLLLRITDPGGRPVAGRVFMSVRPLDGGGTRVGTSVTADPGGAARHRRIVPGRYKLYFKADGRGETTVEVVLDAGENRVEVALDPFPER